MNQNNTPAAPATAERVVSDAAIRERADPHLVLADRVDQLYSQMWLGILTTFAMGALATFEFWETRLRDLVLFWWLPAGHEWSFDLGADRAIRWDQFALALGACSPTSPIAYHCDEDVGRRLTTAEMAARINRYRLALGTRLKAIVADSQGPTGHWIFEELSRVHRLPLERAKKGSKDDGVELISSDLVGGRMLIKAGSELARQLRELRRPFPTLPTSRQPHQKDDVADAWIYARRRMTHMFGRTPASAPDVAAAAAADKARQLQAMQRRQRDRLDPWAAIRGPVHGRF